MTLAPLLARKRRAWPGEEERGSLFKVVLERCGTGKLLALEVCAAGSRGETRKMIDLMQRALGNGCARQTKSVTMRVCTIALGQRDADEPLWISKNDCLIRNEK